MYRKETSLPTFESRVSAIKHRIRCHVKTGTRVPIYLGKWGPGFRISHFPGENGDPLHVWLTVFPGVWQTIITGSSVWLTISPRVW